MDVKKATKITNPVLPVPLVSGIRLALTMLPERQITEYTYDYELYYINTISIYIYIYIIYTDRFYIFNI